MFRLPGPVLVVGAGSAIGALVFFGLILFIPPRDEEYVLAAFAVFILGVCLVALNLPPVVRRASRVRWDPMPEPETCPECQGSGVLRYLPDGTRVPLPAHLAASFGSGHICPLCRGQGSIA